MNQQTLEWLKSEKVSFREESARLDIQYRKGTITLSEYYHFLVEVMTRYERNVGAIIMHDIDI